MNSLKWLDRTQPQTLFSSCMLLYIHTVFAVIFGTYTYFPWGLLVTALSFVGGLGIANEKKIGYFAGIGAAVFPFFLRFVVWNGLRVSFFDRLTGGNLINFLFEVALVALILHPDSRNYQRIWFK